MYFTFFIGFDWLYIIVMIKIWGVCILMILHNFHRFLNFIVWLSLDNSKDNSRDNS